MTLATQYRAEITEVRRMWGPTRYPRPPLDPARVEMGPNLVRLLLAVLTGVVLLAGCSPATVSPEPIGTSTPTRSSAPTPGDADWETAENNVRYGETIRYMAYGDVPLEITVSAPKEFTPAKDASVFDRRSTLGGEEGKLWAVNVYFDVKIKNVSTSDKYEADFLFTDVSGTADDEKVSTIEDDDHEGIERGTIGAQRALTAKDAFSVTSADEIVYELDIDGLKGKTFTFHR